MAGWLAPRGLTARQAVDLPPVWLLGAIGLVWLQVRLWPGGTVAFPGRALVAGALFWGGLALMGWALWSFRRHRTTPVPHQVPRAVITTGPFALSRNPIYLGDLMVLAGVIAGQGAWPSLVLLPLLAAILKRRFIAPEEARMKENFGPAFAEYAENTRRWL